MICLKEAKKKYQDFDLSISLDVKPGQITGLIGQNGAGKSTTFKLILGLISKDGGEVTIFGKPTEEIGKKERLEMGVVMAESFFNKIFNVKEILQIEKTMYPGFDEEWFTSRCKEQKIPMDKPISEFSTGMCAKIKVLFAMAHKARLLLLDEPTAGLDVVAREEVLDLLREYMENGETSILISSHISSDLEGFCDDLYFIKDGSVLLHEDTDILLSEYGILKLTEEQYQNVDRTYLLGACKESYGYRCLTKERGFYEENLPGVVVEKGNIDDVMGIIVKGELSC